MKFDRVLLIGFILMLPSNLAIAQIQSEQIQSDMGAGDRRSDHVGTMPVMLDIPSQPLETALKAFSGATQVALFYESSVISGRRSFALHGEFPADTGLRQMLQGTGLSITSFERGTITILPTMASDEASEVKRAKAGMVEFSHYLASVQKSLDLAFCHAPAVATDPDEMLVRLWVAPSGEVRQADLLSGTGSDDRDRIYLATLGALAIDARPPAAMPQPINLMLRPKQSVRSASCSALGTAARSRAHE